MTAIPSKTEATVVEINEHPSSSENDQAIDGPASAYKTSCEHIGEGKILIYRVFGFILFWILILSTLVHFYNRNEQTPIWIVSTGILSYIIGTKFYMPMIVDNLIPPSVPRLDVDVIYIAHQNFAYFVVSLATIIRYVYMLNRIFWYPFFVHDEMIWCVLPVSPSSQFQNRGLWLLMQPLCSILQIIIATIVCRCSTRVFAAYMCHMKQVIIYHEYLAQTKLQQPVTVVETTAVVEFDTKSIIADSQSETEVESTAAANDSITSASLLMATSPAEAQPLLESMRIDAVECVDGVGLEQSASVAKVEEHAETVVVQTKNKRSTKTPRTTDIDDIAAVGLNDWQMIMLDDAATEANL